MKMLLDENLPNKLLKELLGHEVYTSRKMGWLGFKNGALIKLMIDNGFDALITFDKNIQYQQNFSKYPITVFHYLQRGFNSTRCTYAQSFRFKAAQFLHFNYQCLYLLKDMIITFMSFGGNAGSYKRFGVV